MSAKSRNRRSHRPQFRRRTEPGAPPGTLVADPNAPRGEMHVLAFDAERYDERTVAKVDALPEFLSHWPVTWINVDGVGDASIVVELGKQFNLHRLALEDVVHVHQRAKAESYGEYYFIVARMHSHEQRGQTEQISFFLGKNFVLTFQEHPGGDCLEPVRTRIRAGWGRNKAVRTDHLVYALLDSIVDHYFPLVEECGEQLDSLENDMFVGTVKGIMGRIHCVKRDLLTIRRVVWPMRDAINTLLRDQTPLISEETRVYLRDVHDHTIQIIDLVESYRDISSGITDVYLSSVSQRTNDIMKVLTIISTIFIPLTFIAGVYGMNFEHMPELKWVWGYPLIMSMMGVVAAGLVAYFRRQGWWERKERKVDDE